MPQGYETGRYGNRLTQQLRDSKRYQDWLVYYDHGDTAVDANVAAIKGFFGTAVKNVNRLADVDILVASPDGAARLLIEIEERACSPKKFLGDVLAILLCNQVAVRVQGRQQTFMLSPETKVIVAGILPGRGHRLQRIEGGHHPAYPRTPRSARRNCANERESAVQGDDRRYTAATGHGGK